LRAVRRVLDETIEIDRRPAMHSDHTGVLVEVELAAGGAPQAAPDPDAVELARRLLAEGRDAALARRSERRGAGAAGLLAAPLAIAMTYRGRLPRRRFLRACGVGAAAGAAAIGAGAFGLAESLIPDELAAYDDALRRLASLGPHASGGRSGPSKPPTSRSSAAAARNTLTSS
jgi:hypothetical protein